MALKFKFIRRIFFLLILFFCLFPLLFSSSIFALDDEWDDFDWDEFFDEEELESEVYTLTSHEDAIFSLYPDSGEVEVDKEFIVDILIDTKAQEAISARAVLRFNSNLLQVVNAERNEDLFCDWPEHEQLIDNHGGMLMVSGFCQNFPYATYNEEDVFARITFLPVKEGKITLDWEFSGRDEPYKSVIISDGSPPQNILFRNSVLDIIPGTFEAIKKDKDEEPRPVTEVDSIPETAIFSSLGLKASVIIGAGVCLIGFGVYICLDPRRKYLNNSRTVVVYAEES